MRVFRGLSFWLFSIFVTAFNFVVFVLFFAIPFSWMIAARNWEPVPARILQVEMNFRRSMSYISIDYLNKYRKQDFRGDRYNFNRGNSGKWRKLPPELGQGKMITAYVNPQFPAEAVIKRSWSWDGLLWCLVPLPFIFIFGLASLGGLFCAIQRVKAVSRLRRLRALQNRLSKCISIAGSTRLTDVFSLVQLQRHSSVDALKKFVK